MQKMKEINELNTIKEIIKELDNKFDVYYKNEKFVSIHININRNDVCVRYSFIPEKINISDKNIYIEYKGIQTIINRKIEEIIIDPDDDGQDSYLFKMGYMEIYIDFN